MSKIYFLGTGWGVAWKLLLSRFELLQALLDTTEKSSETSQSSNTRHWTSHTREKVDKQI